MGELGSLPLNAAGSLHAEVSLGEVGVLDDPVAVLDLGEVGVVVVGEDAPPEVTASLNARLGYLNSGSSDFVSSSTSGTSSSSGIFSVS